MRTTLPLLAALALLASPRVVRAEDPRGAARAHYARGLELASQNGYEAALREFNEAYALSPEFAVLYNIGQAHIALGRSAEAIDALTRYLREGAERVPPGRRAQVQAQIAYLHAELPNPDLSPEADAERAAAAAAGAAAGGAFAAATDPPRPSSVPGTLSIRCPDPGIKLTLDGKTVDAAVTARGLSVRPGTHRLALAAPGRRPGEHNIDVPAGASTIVICENPAAAPAIDRPRYSLDGPPVFSTALAAAEAPPPVHASTLGYVLGGLGVAFGGAALGVYLWNRGQYNDAKAAGAQVDPDLNASDHYDPAVSYNARVDSINRVNYLIDGLAIASVGLVASGVYFWRTDRKRAEKVARPGTPRGWAAVSPTGLSLGGVW